MPWSNQTGGGGWKSGNGGGGGGPWGQGPGGGQSPDFEDMIKRSQDKVRRAMGSGGGGGGSSVPSVILFLGAVVGALVVAWYAFFFEVQPNQQGVVLRFGEHVRTEGEGLHFRLPYPIEQVYLPNVTLNNAVELGVRTVDSFRGNLSEQDVPEESLMLTGDENIVDVDFVVQWRIKNVEDYLFNIQNPDSTVKEVAESTMREVVGTSNIAPLLTEERAKTEQQVFELMQKTLDSYGAGVEITGIQMKKADPPAKVIDAFRDVQAAKADQERLQNEANAYANRVVPEARGAAERILQAAQGYRDQTVAEATGEAARFEKVYDEYRKAPDVTRKRMFLETMERVYGDTDKIILDDKGGSGVVPYLPLNELTRPRSGGSTSGTAGDQ
jgi:modulator of FtsH protease HflK